jgi:hypothetical protein
MPVAPTYPGVYIQEIPSGVRTITGVATSITAFVGRALKGPDNEPITINSYADYERTFGGLWQESAMSYAVSDFYMNGGSQAVIVRLFKAETEDADDREAEAKAEANALLKKILNAISKKTEKVAAYNAAKGIIDKTSTSASSTPGEIAAGAEFLKAISEGQTITVLVDNLNAALTGAETNAAAAIPAATSTSGDTTEHSNSQIGAGGLTFTAATKGSWGNNLRIRIEYADDATREKAAKKLGLEKGDLFNLIVHDTKSGAIETFLNLTDKDHAKRVDRVLENNSTLIRLKTPVTTWKVPVANRDMDDEESPWEGVNSYDVSETEKASDGKVLTNTEFVGSGTSAKKKGLFSLEKADIFNLLCIPPHEVDGNIDTTLISKALVYCEKRRAIFIVDPPSDWNTKKKAKDYISTIEKSKNGAIYFPRLRKPNPLRDNQMENFAPCGAIAGVIARTDSTRGVWKAPAGLEASLKGVPALSVPLTDMENGELNPLGINCMRAKPAAGRIVWGSRTLEGDDRLGSEWKYLPVRRVALYIEESLYRGTQWAVFEGNDEPLWSQIRLNLGSFMHNLYRQGAFQGKMPADAYFVKCDGESTTQADINLGIVNVIVGFAPLKPAEFVIISIQQKAGQLAT